MLLRATKELYIPEELDGIISFISLNNPILSSLKEKPEAKENQKASPPGVLRVWGIAKMAVAKFALNCWDDENPSPLCEVGTTPLTVEIDMRNLALNFPATTYSVTWDEVDCKGASASGKEKACDPFETDEPDKSCTCGVHIGPLPQYSPLMFSGRAVASVTNSDGTTEKATFDLGSTPQPYSVGDLTTPFQLKKMYNIPQTATVKHGATVATPEDGVSFSNEDLKIQMELSGINEHLIPDALIIGDYPNDATNPSKEPSLDVQFIATIAQNASLSYYSIADCENCLDEEFFLKWLFYVSMNEKPEMAHGISYLAHELHDGNSSDVRYREFFDRIDIEFIKLGLQGSTLVFSAGDNGVCSFAGNSDNTKGCKAAMPEWPASSPYITSAGATQLSDRYLPVCGAKWSSQYDLAIQCSGVQEIGAQSDKGSIVTSGGGFSFLYDSPWYQQKHVSEYVTGAASMEGFPSTQGFFNPNGRGYPDISAYGANYATIQSKGLTFYCGTSASAPFLSAVITLLNDRLLAEGFSPVGFFNPLLYYLKETRPEIFNDITIGSNACREGLLSGTTPLDCNEEYFTARPGWDPISGLGSFDFERMAEAVLEIARSHQSVKTDDDLELIQEVATDESWVLFLFPGVVAAVSLIVAMQTHRKLTEDPYSYRKQYEKRYGALAL
eukprot:CAMPEP_0117741006 /NCGR_PEP_ID=MMETSP0947-20121206/4661_1 /TAXON_ID=44440 /ORGANISM="Chattonella subsalsa, Strain CCMP2191" /LENGTH=669 /DNA_ID=CAMNT_0005557191 /DNA_START=475 /DNA_END=2484 /DNA_ORIENTATION=-